MARSKISQAKYQTMYSVMKTGEKWGKLIVFSASSSPFAFRSLPFPLSHLVTVLGFHFFLFLLTIEFSFGFLSETKHWVCLCLWEEELPSVMKCLQKLT